MKKEVKEKVHIKIHVLISFLKLHLTKDIFEKIVFLMFMISFTYLQWMSFELSTCMGLLTHVVLDMSVICFVINYQRENHNNLYLVIPGLEGSTNYCLWCSISFL